MSTSSDYPIKDRPIYVWCDETDLHVRLGDKRVISTPLWWYPTLWNANPTQRADYELMLGGIHWPQIDEDISVEGMLAGAKAPNAVDPSQRLEAAE